MPLVFPTPETQPIEEQPKAQPGTPTQVGPPPQPAFKSVDPLRPPTEKPTGRLVMPSGLPNTPQQPGAPPGPAQGPQPTLQGRPQDPELARRAQAWVLDSPYSPVYYAKGLLHTTIDAMGYPSRLIESTITGNKGYENYYKELYPNLDPRGL